MAKRARKTWPIEDLKKRANRYMRNPQLSREEKDIIQGFISDILYHAGQYKGFGYIEWSKDGGCQRWMDDGRPADKTPYLGEDKFLA